MEKLAFLAETDEQLKTLKELGVEEPQKGIYTYLHEQWWWHDVTEQSFFKEIGYHVITCLIA